MARLVRNSLVTIALYIGWFVAFAKLDLYADEQSLEWLRVPAQFAILVTFGAIAIWLYEGDKRAYWVLALAVSTGATVAFVVGLPDLHGWTFFAACFAFGAAGLLAGSVLVSKLVGYRANRATARIE